MGGVLESACGKRNRENAGGEAAIVSDWSVDYFLEVCGKGEEDLFKGKVQFFEEYWAPSVDAVVRLLNLGTFQCPDGFGVLWSKHKGAYILLFRPGMKQKALARLEVDEATLATRAKVRFSPDKGEYLVVLQKTEGTALGIDVELKEHAQLFVRTITDAGLVADWNAANPSKQIEVGHVMAKVNGAWSSHDEILGAVKEGGQLNIVFRIPPPPKVQPPVEQRPRPDPPAKANPQASVQRDQVDAVRIGFDGETNQPSEVILDFSVTLDKPSGTSLGLDVTAGSTNRTLIVKGIKVGGPAQTWNDANPDKVLMVDDEIIQVNSAVGDTKVLIEECKKSEVLEMKVRRINKESNEI
jgi:hypothetical protein